MDKIWAIVGDSFSDPRHSGYVEHGITPWPALVSRRLGVEVRNFASSGDGYVHRRSVTFPEQAARAAADSALDRDSVERVIVYGGINDSSSGEDLGQVREQAAVTARALADAFPAARIEGFMNWYPHDFDDEARAYVGAIRDGLAEASVPLRTDSMWILENDEVEDAYLADNLHPNQHGHDLIAAFFANENRDAGKRNSSLLQIEQGENVFPGEGS